MAVTQRYLVIWANVRNATLVRQNKGDGQGNGEFRHQSAQKSFKKEYDYLGSHSGRDGDKFAAMNIKWEDAAYVNAPILTDCPVNIECSVIESTMPGTHELFVAKVEKVHVDEEYEDGNGNILWDKMDLM